MKLFDCLSSFGLLVTSSFVLHSFGIAAQNASSPWPVHDNGLNDVVEWDHYSFKVNGKRLFVFSGELHYWRIPVPEVWRDLLEKIKAAGFTAYAFYGNWGYHSPNNFMLDFTTGAHDFSPLLEIAKEVGLYVIVRPGPYVNAEANAGGFPLWLTTGAYGKLRNDDPRYTEAWKPYFAKYSEITSKHLVTNGGNAFVYQMENEYGQQWVGDPTHRVPNVPAGNYMQMLQDSARENGIDIPVIHNDPNMWTRSWSKDFSNSTGNVDVAGLDSYPSCWSCNLDECTGTNGEYVAYQTINYYDHFIENSVTQPKFFPEFQGGSYNPWDGPQGGCPNDIGADFANLFYRDLISQQISAISLYMMYGGTNWGAFAAPVTATSYDYSSPISENRIVGNKFYETKNLAMFTRVAHDLTMTDRLGNSTRYSTNPAIKSKILVTDFTLGDERLIYSTAEVLTFSIVDRKPVLVLSVGIGESVEFYLKGAKEGKVAKNRGASDVKFHRESHGLIVNLAQGPGASVIKLDNGVTVVVADKITAYKIWAPNLTNDPFAPVDKSVIVEGPYLVRGVFSSDEGKTLALTGDSAITTAIEVFASRSVRTLTWNGKNLNTSRTEYGSLTAHIQGVSHIIKLPPLDTWKVHDSLSEALPDYDDSGIAWVEADHTTTPNPTKPDTLPVLYVDDYGFHNSLHLFRGYFSGPATGVHISIAGGTAFGWSAWLNNIHIGSFFGNSTFGSETGNLTLSFSNATLHTDTSNILLIVQDNTGHGLREQATNPRGILNATLTGTNTTFKKWEIAGTAGGDNKILDPVRGPLNEGGLVAERLGWHLPGYDASSWNASSPSTGFSGAGIKFYRTTVPLDIPKGLDVSIGFILNAPGPQAIRVQLFVNGYQYARFNPYIGNQIEFPVPPGVLNYSGENTIGWRFGVRVLRGRRWRLIGRSCIVWRVVGVLALIQSI
ncbi:glycoside hydrolase family 35 protein [Zopfia rhizophila CBS 207.26]|uniref:beta-galactosidase n=1 Tax=Zopfia rhizophila CBS 207.26 TaxID=1314779 RepID=A0A6A6EG65_9PEZI|nr:glycoside hydrolase family 35 protein [Zopfia rhizophila CBS 207.26]